MIHPVTEEHVQIVQKALVDYTISGEMLGKGAFGWVFPAEHKETKKQVVVKITTDIVSHNQERKYARLMSHPHSVPLEAAGARLRPKMGWLVFARIETSLYNWCDAWKANPESAPQSKRERVAATLLVQLLPLLKVLEEKNISHRDLHPGNILVDTKEPWFYIHDYGISTAFETNDNRNYRRDTVGLIRSARYVIVLDKWKGGIDTPEEYTPHKLPKWLNDIIDIMHELPAESRVPYSRLQAIAKRFLRPSNQAAMEERDNEVVRLGMQMLDKNRHNFEAMLNRIVKNGPVKLKSRAKLFTENDIQVLEPHPDARVFVYPDEGEAWMHIIANGDKVCALIEVSMRHLSILEQEFRVSRDVPLLA